MTSQSASAFSSSSAKANPFDEGRSCFRSGGNEFEDCGYTQGSQPHQAWIEGFLFEARKAESEKKAQSCGACASCSCSG